MTDLSQATHAPADKRRVGSRLRVLFWAVGILGAALQAIAFRQSISADSLSYFDMSDSVSALNLRGLVNATWSPLYPVVVGLLTTLLHPAPRWEFPVAHLANFFCFIFAFASFEFLFRSLENSTNLPGSGMAARLPRWALIVIGYSAFLWASLGMLTLMLPSPDMLMTAFLYLAAGFLVRIHRGQASWQIYLALGAVLGLGYLAKAIMFPLAIVTVTMTLLAAGPFRTRTLRTLVAGISFIVVAGPYLLAVSHLAHHPTFGEAGTVVHLTHVDKIDGYFQNTGAATGTFVHPMKRILSLDPPAFLFARTVPATYPFWYDPYYWSEGVRPGFRLGTQARLFIANVLVYLRMALGLSGLVAAALLMCYLAGIRQSILALQSYWPVIVLGLVALGAYATLYVENRYLGGFIVLMIAAPMFGLRVFQPVPTRMLAVAVSVIVLNLGLNTAINLRKTYTDAAYISQMNDSEAALALWRTGVAAGDSVAAITPSMASGWARLAKVHIIVDIQRRKTPEFWQGTAEYQKTAFDAFTAAGCKAVVARIGHGPAAAGWQKLGDSVYAVHLLH